MNSENSNSVGRYIGAICISFFFSILSSFILFPLAIRCDNIGAFWGICIFAGMVIIVGFVGVFTGTLIFQKLDRRKASRHLLLFGLGFCVLLLPIFRFGILPLILPVALGGFSAVIIFKKLDNQISESNYRRFLGASASVAFGIIVLFVATIAWIGRTQEITADKAAKIFEKAGGIEKVQQEAFILFNKAGTNDFYWLQESDKTNYPALTSLGFVMVEDQRMRIRFGGHFHTKFIFITPTASITNAHDKEFYSSGCIQISTNIFITK